MIIDNKAVQEKSMEIRDDSKEINHNFIKNSLSGISKRLVNRLRFNIHKWKGVEDVEFVIYSFSVQLINYTRR